MCCELVDYLIKCGYDKGYANEIHRLYCIGGIDRAVNAFNLLDYDTYGHHTKRLVKAIQDWRQENPEILNPHLEGVSYIILDNGTIPKMQGDYKMYAIRTSISEVKEVKSDELLVKPKIEPKNFWVVGTDEESIKKEICKKIDQMFHAYEYEQIVEMIQNNSVIWKVRNVTATGSALDTSTPYGKLMAEDKLFKVWEYRDSSYNGLGIFEKYYKGFLPKVGDVLEFYDGKRRFIERIEWRGMMEIYCK